MNLAVRTPRRSMPYRRHESALRARIHSLEERLTQVLSDDASHRPPRLVIEVHQPATPPDRVAVVRAERRPSEPDPSEPVVFVPQPSSGPRRVPPRGFTGGMLPLPRVDEDCGVDELLAHLASTIEEIGRAELETEPIARGSSVTASVSLPIAADVMTPDTEALREELRHARVALQDMQPPVEGGWSRPGILAYVLGLLRSLWSAATTSST